MLFWVWRVGNHSLTLLCFVCFRISKNILCCNQHPVEYSSTVSLLCVNIPSLLSRGGSVGSGTAAWVMMLSWGDLLWSLPGILSSSAGDVFFFYISKGSCSLNSDTSRSILSLAWGWTERHQPIAGERKWL